MIQHGAGVKLAVFIRKQAMALRFALAGYEKNIVPYEFEARISKNSNN